MRAAAASTSVPGRFEVVADGDGGELVLDGAHNAGGIAALVESLPAFLAGRPLVAVVSVLDDKDARAMLERLLGAVRGRRVHGQRQPARDRAPTTLAELAGELRRARRARASRPTRAARSSAARELAGPRGVVLATGSIYLVADLKRPAGAGRGSML